jgi:hypothetical protein
MLVVLTPSVCYVSTSVPAVGRRCFIAMTAGLLFRMHWITGFRGDRFTPGVVVMMRLVGR